MAVYECRGKKQLWSVRFRVIENGKELHKRLSGFERKRDAERAYLEFMQQYEINQRMLSPNQQALERQFVDIYLEFMLYKKNKYKESSFYEYTKIAEKHILPVFAKMKIRNITKTKILNFQNSLNRYSYKYKTKIRGFLYSIFKYLYLYYDIDNVVARVEPFTKPVQKQEMSIWNLNDFEKFITTFGEDFLYKTFFTMLYFTGCRLGELLAINFSDIDFNTKKLSISKSISSKSFDKAFYVTTPKNQSSIREIMLSNNLIDVINDYILAYPHAKEATFFLGGEKPLDDHTIYRRLEKHCDIAGIKKIRIHDFRHSHASLLINNGANVVLVAKRLGHSSTEQTLNTYAHLFPDSENLLIDKLNNL